ncbi:SDR family NAD(P)-dependent oxidoreductase [Parageobacillus thermoglucosidasius]|jgi:2-hydroxycyclohexanecarboxyl-CoA dehydrogenase|uniref:SDR family NAD(P)-dependent oxidoreductase n=1 Tax=Parageobacillus thermoglucosidasius TaxID=1426 RepID=UPI000B561EE5|nr:3-oxoacyl-ACP reductase family protein [Parageobacillus thermoglucosidasius]OUM88012.1 MAG: 2-hydroxycyclohexanecarboxyl-CoA dehydrogenase [Parageobacillus thermoglucosidasius]
MTAQRVAFITGAGRGIGAAIAIKLASQRMSIVVADINEENATETVRSIKNSGGDAITVRCDVTSLDNVIEAVEKVKSHYGKIDVLVNNAGWEKVEPFLKSEPETWEKVIAINLMGTIHTCKVILPIMIENGYGKVINIASDAGRVGSTGEAVYSAAKGGVIAFSKTLAREMARYKINVNCVAPGPTDTPLFAEMVNEGLKEALEKAIPFRRLAQPEDIAGAVAYLASEDANYVTGQTLSVSGGLTMI